MKSHTTGSSLLTIIASTLIILCSTTVNSALYTISQDGFSGGGTITGSFEAIDFDNDGIITSGCCSPVDFNGDGVIGSLVELAGREEVRSFSFSFTNDSIVGNFSENWFSSFAYHLGSEFIGDISGDGINTGAGPLDEFNRRRYDYLTGLGHTGILGGLAADNFTGAISTSSNLVSVSESPHTIPAAVPIPAAVWFFGTGLIWLIGMGGNGRKSETPV